MIGVTSLLFIFIIGTIFIILQSQHTIQVEMIMVLKIGPNKESKRGWISNSLVKKAIEPGIS